MACAPCRILWIPTKQLFNGTGPAFSRLLGNLSKQLSGAYFSLQRRLICLSQPTLRERLQYYLQMESRAQGSSISQLYKTSQTAILFLSKNSFFSSLLVGHACFNTPAITFQKRF